MLSRVEIFLKRRCIVFVWTGENGGFQIRRRHAQVLGSLLCTNDSRTLRVDVDFFKSGGCLRFRKYPATCGRSNTIRKRYVWTQISFEYGEKVSKIPGYVWTGPK